jgi:predicted nucleic acid-binding protein
LVDTRACYPAVVSNHADHHRVSKALTDRVQRRQRVVTTNLVIAETHALLLHRVHRDAALAFTSIVRQSPNLVVYADARLEQAALEWLERFKDQDFSLCDAVSFSVMASRRISEALTLDGHFVAAGFSVVPPRGP